MRVWVVTTTRQWEIQGHKTSGTFVDSVWSSKEKATQRFQKIRSTSIDVIMLGMYETKVNTLEQGELFMLAPPSTERKIVGEI